MQTELLEKYEGRLLHELQRQTTISRMDIYLHIIKFGLYFLSNKMFTESRAEEFLDWIITNGPRTISILEDFLRQKVPTMEVAMYSIFRPVLSVVSLREARLLVTSEPNPCMNFPSSDFEPRSEPRE